jgi:hypothetical protein
LNRFINPLSSAMPESENRDKSANRINRFMAFTLMAKGGSGKIV